MQISFSSCDCRYHSNLPLPLSSDSYFCLTLHHPPPLSITLTDAHIALAHLWFVLHKTHLIMCLVTLLPKYVQCTLLFLKVFI